MEESWKTRKGDVEAGRRKKTRGSENYGIGEVSNTRAENRSSLHIDDSFSKQRINTSKLFLVFSSGLFWRSKRF